MAKKAKVQKVITLTNIQDTLNEMSPDVEKFNNGVQAAGARIRKGAQAIKVLCQSLRKDVTDIKNARK